MMELGGRQGREAMGVPATVRAGGHARSQMGPPGGEREMPCGPRDARPGSHYGLKAMAPCVQGDESFRQAVDAELMGPADRLLVPSDHLHVRSDHLSV